MEDTLLTLSTHYAGATIRSVLRYFIICGGAFAVFWVFLSGRLEHRKIQAGVPPRKMNVQEMWASVYATLIIALVTAGTLWLNELGMVKIYMDPMEYGVPWLVVSMVILVFGFDTYFYWSHRLMHHVALYKLTHEKHHEFTDPSPLAAYSFTAWEALSYAAFAPPLLLVLPMNFWALLAAGSWFTIAATLVHLGYEVAPSWWGKSPFTRWIGTSTMHNMHHEHVHCNYALYFTFWDRWMGTMHPDYAETLEDLTHQPLFQRSKQPAPANGVS